MLGVRIHRGETEYTEEDAEKALIYGAPVYGAAGN
jgi:hypothetical protein